MRSDVGSIRKLYNYKLADFCFIACAKCELVSTWKAMLSDAIANDLGTFGIEKLRSRQ